MADLGKAYVQIVPSAEGIAGTIGKVLNAESSGAGKDAGANIGSGIGKFATRAVAALGVGTAVSNAISKGMNFETMSAKASTLFTGTNADFQNLQQSIMDISSATGVSAAELMNAAYSAESASVPMANLGGIIDASSRLATAGFTDIDTALSATAKTMNAYGMVTDDAASTQASMEAVQRVLMQTQNRGITTVGELGASLANVTPTAAAAGVNFEQVGASLALMTAKGTPTAQATTQLRSAIGELSKSGTKASSALAAAAEGTEYAGMSFTDMMASGADLSDVMGMLQQYADKSGLSMLDLWSSVEGGNAAMAIASDVGTFKDDLAAMGTEADVVGEAYGKMADTTSFKLQKFKNTLSNLGIKAFSAAIGPVTKAFEGIQKVVTLVSPAFSRLGTAFSKFFGKLDGYAADLLGLDGEFSASETIAGLLNTAIDTLAGVFDFLAEHIDVLVPVLAGLTGGFAAFKALSIAGTIGGVVTKITSLSAAAGGLIPMITGLIGPFGIAAIAIGAVIAIGVALYKNWDTVKAAAAAVGAAVKKAWEALKKALATTVDAIKKKITTVWNGIKTAVSNTATAIKTKVTNVWTQIKTAMANLLTSIKTKVVNVWTQIKTAIANILTTVKTKITNVWTQIKTAIANILTSVKTKVTNVWTQIKTAMSNLLTSIKTKVANVWTQIKTAIANILTAIKTKISDIWSQIKERIASVITAIKEKVSAVWIAIKEKISSIVTAIKTKVTNTWTTIKTSISNVMTAVKTKITNVWTQIKTNVSNKLSAMKTSISNTFTSIKDGIKNKIDAAKDAVKKAVDKIKSAMNFHWSLPHLKLPHFSASGKFSINPPSVPHFSVSWYKQGAIINGASVVGVGEAGPEAIIPLSGPSMEPFASVIADELMANGASADRETVALLKKYLPLLANMKVVLDKGRLVGELTPAIDARMGTIAARKGRGN